MSDQVDQQVAADPAPDAGSLLEGASSGDGSQSPDGGSVSVDFASAIAQLPEDKRGAFEGMSSFDDVHTALSARGVPEQYSVDFKAAGVDDARAGEMATLFKDAGLSDDGAKKIMDWYASQDAAYQKSLDEAKAAGKAALDAEYGAANVPSKLEAAKSEILKHGGQAALNELLEAGLGNSPAVLKMFVKLAESGQPDRVNNGLPVGDSLGGMTQEQAAREIASLKKDAKFVKSYLAGEVDSVSLMDKLHKIAYPKAQ